MLPSLRQKQAAQAPQPHCSKGQDSTMSQTEKIVADEKAKLDFSASMSYGDYLHLY